MFLIFYLFLIIGPNFVQPLKMKIMFSQLSTVYNIGTELYSKIADLTNYAQFLSDTNEIDLKNILTEVKDVSDKIDEVQDRIEQKIEVAVQTLIERIPLKQQVNSVTDEIVKHISRIDNLYDEFMDYSNGKKNYNKLLLGQFVTILTSPNSNDLQDHLNQIESQVIPGRTSTLADGYLVLLSKQTEASKLELCDTGISPQQKLYEFYSTVMLTEIRGYVMTIFGFAILEGIHNSTFASSMERANEKFQKRTLKYFNTFIRAAKAAPTDIRTCDPPVQIRGETFSEFAGFMQGFVVPESDITLLDDCEGSCDKLKDVGKNKTVYRNKDKWLRQKNCDGTVHYCGYGGGDITVCEMPEDSPRRYEWFRDDGGTMYGKKKDCQGKEISTSGWSRGFVKCDYCICVCQSTHINSSAIRAISLEDQITNTGENMVVAGVRLIEKDKMIQIQIQEGKLTEQGEIVDNSTKWLELDHLLFADQHQEDFEVGNFYKIVGNDEEIEAAKKNNSLKSLQMTKLREEMDFMFLKGFRRSMSLDDIYVQPNHVITGARFQYLSLATNPNNKFGAFILEVRATPFNFETGELDKKSPHKWISALSMRKEEKPPEYIRKRTEFKMSKNSGNPIDSKLNLPDSQPNQYVTFLNSDFRKDAAQSTIPFIDSVPLTTTPPLALGGMGIFHKGHDGFGGFISPRIMNLDMTMYMKNEK